MLVVSNLERFINTSINIKSGISDESSIFVLVMLLDMLFQIIFPETLQIKKRFFNYSTGQGKLFLSAYAILFPEKLFFEMNILMDKYKINITNIKLEFILKVDLKINKVFL